MQPTVGRIVWYYEYGPTTAGNEKAAIIVKVTDEFRNTDGELEFRVNLCVFNDGSERLTCWLTKNVMFFANGFPTPGQMPGMAIRYPAHESLVSYPFKEDQPCAC